MTEIDSVTPLNTPAPCYGLYIPGWYPQTTGDMSGIFFKNQFDLLAEHYSLRLMTPNIRSIRRNRPGRKLKYDSLSRPLVRRPWRPLSEQWAAQFQQRYLRSLQVFGRPSMLHLNGASARCDPEMLKTIRASGVKIISSEHESLFLTDMSLELRDRVRAVHKQCHEVTAVSSALALAVQEVSDRRVEILPNVVNVDPSFFQPTPPHDITLVTACALTDVKRLHVLIEALAIVQRSMHARLTVIGDGPLRAPLEKLAHEKCAPRTVDFVGQLDQKNTQRQIARATIYVNASQYETFGVAIGEALNMGIPVVCTSSGGPADFVTASNGRIVPSADPDEFAANITHVLQNMFDYDRNAISSKFRAKYGPGAFRDRIDRLYPRGIRRGEPR